MNIDNLSIRISASPFTYATMLLASELHTLKEFEALAAVWRHSHRSRGLNYEVEHDD